MTVKLSPLFNDAQLDTSGNPYSGALLFTYGAGGSTKQTTYQEQAGLTPHTNPIVLNARGEPPAPIWLTEGLEYKFVLTIPTDTDPPAAAIRTVDDVSGVNDGTGLVDEWIASGFTPTFVNATSFTVPGDRTSVLHVGRRLKTTNTGGTIYSRIESSSHAAGTTTVTVVNDSGTLDSGLSAVSYGAASAINTSMPGFKASDGYMPQVAGTRTMHLPPPLGYNLVGGYLDWTVSGNVLTVAVKTWAGNDPSATEPVFYPVRDVTASTGSLTYRKLTAATSISINDTALLGTANSVAFRLWCVIFNDGGTDRLAVINCVTTAAGAGAGRDVAAIYPLAGFGIASATQEGDGADSAQVFYSHGAAVSSKAYTTLGYGTWESGLGTAGTWSAGPTRKQLFGPGVPLPGHVIQVQRNDTGVYATGTTVMPADDSIPQSGEGDQYMSQAITPTSAANALRVVGRAWHAHSGTGQLSVALFQDSVANALCGQGWGYRTGDDYWGTALEKLVLAAGTASTTFKWRAGLNNAGTTRFNGASGARAFGGVANSFLQVEEVMG